MRLLKLLKELPKHVKVQLWLLLILPLNFLLVFLADTFPQAVETVYSNGFFPSAIRALSVATGILPFSLAEFLVVTAVIFAVVILILWIRKIILTVREKGRVWTLITDYVSRTLAILFCGIFLFNVMYGFSYYRRNTTSYVYDKYVKYTDEDIAWVASFLAYDLNKAREALNIPDDEPYTLPYSYSEIARVTMDSYKKLGEEYPVFSGTYGAPKPVALSKPWTYTFVMGMYFPFTGEANYNTNVPDAELLHTVLHEMAHQRGIAAEDEANFAAFLATVYSDDPHVKYSGYFESFIAVTYSIRYRDPELYSQLMEQVNDGVKKDMEEVERFWEGYTTPLADISNDINNAYLESNGQEMGVASYSLSTQYILDYYVNTYLSDYIKEK